MAQTVRDELLIDKWYKESFWLNGITRAFDWMVQRELLTEWYNEHTFKSWRTVYHNLFCRNKKNKKILLELKFRITIDAVNYPLCPQHRTTPFWALNATIMKTAYNCLTVFSVIIFLFVGYYTGNLRYVLDTWARLFGINNIESWKV